MHTLFRRLGKALFVTALLSCLTPPAFGQAAPPGSCPSAPQAAVPAVQQTPSIVLPGSYWEERSPLKAGDMAPTWTLPLAGDMPGVKKGTLLNFSHWRGNRKTVIVFWAFWCDTWKDATRYFGLLRSGLKAHGVKLIAVTVDASQQPVARNAFASGQIYFPVAIDETSAVTARWQVRRVPTVFAIGADGGIRARWEGLPKQAALFKVLNN